MKHAKSGVRRFIAAFLVFVSRVRFSKVSRVTNQTKTLKAEMNFRTPNFGCSSPCLERMCESLGGKKPRLVGFSALA